MSLFGGTPSQARSRNLVEFKAGKMNLRGNMVHPDKRKGLVYLYQGNDMLMHFCWKERANSSPEDDLVIFPDEIEFKKVTKNTTGRVYILKWRSNARKLFFWMQEPKEDKDEELCKKINDLLNNPPTIGFGDDAAGASGAHPLQSLMDRMAGGGAGGLDSSDLSNVLRGMNPNDLASLISSVGSGGSSAMMPDAFPQQIADSRPSTAQSTSRASGTASAAPAAPAPATAAAVVPSSAPRPTESSSKPKNDGATSGQSAALNRSAPIQMSALTNILANLSGSTPGQTGASASGAGKPSIDLYDIMNIENLVPILSNKDVQEKLRPHLPDGNSLPSSERELRESIQSPQFRQAVSTFSMAFQTGQLGPVLAQFGLPEDAITAANQGDLQAFARAMERHYHKADEKKPSDNTMDTS